MIYFDLKMNFGVRSNLISEIKSIIEEYNDIINTAILFGSTARNDYTDDSDIDLFLTSDKMTSTQLVRHSRCLDLVDRLYNLIVNTQFKLEYDLLFYGKNELKNVKSSLLYKQVEKDGVVLLSSY